MTTQEKIHAILLGFHNNTETFQSANQKIEALIDEAFDKGYSKGFDEGKIWVDPVDEARSEMGLGLEHNGFGI